MDHCLTNESITNRFELINNKTIIGEAETKPVVGVIDDRWVNGNE